MRFPSENQRSDSTRDEPASGEGELEVTGGLRGAGLALFIFGDLVMTEGREFRQFRRQPGPICATGTPAFNETLSMELISQWNYLLPVSIAAW